MADEGSATGDWVTGGSLWQGAQTVCAPSAPGKEASANTVDPGSIEENVESGGRSEGVGAATTGVSAREISAGVGSASSTVAAPSLPPRCHPQVHCSAEKRHFFIW